jgi:hypothetical protein
MPSYLQKTGHIDGRLPAPEIVAAAADLTRHMLNADPKRLIHSEAVARRAESFTLTVDLQSAPLLVAAAWVHDIVTHPRYATRAFIRSTALATCRASAGHQHSATWSPTIPGRVSSPESSSSTGD